MSHCWNSSLPLTWITFLKLYSAMCSPPTYVLHKDGEPAHTEREREREFVLQRSHGRMEAHAEPFTTCTWRPHPLGSRSEMELKDGAQVIFDSQLKWRCSGHEGEIKKIHPDVCVLTHTITCF